MPPMGRLTTRGSLEVSGGRGSWHRESRIDKEIDGERLEVITDRENGKLTMIE